MLLFLGTIIRLENTYIQPKLREHDISIMDIAIQMETLTGQQLQCINGVREWYNIMYASEISTMDGKELLRGIDHGNPQSVQFFPTKRAPKQARPNRKTFRLWKRVLAQLTEPNSNRLTSPLGKWTSHHSTSGIWRSYKSKDKI